MKHLFLLLLLIFLLFENKAAGQVSMSFEDRATTLNSTSTNGQYIDVAGSGTAHELMDYMAPGINIPVNTITSGTTLGFKSFFRPTRAGGTGLADGDIFGYATGGAASSVGAAPTDGTQVFFIEDTDGEVSVIFDEVTIPAGGSIFSMDFIVDGGFEAGNGSNDRVYIALNVSGCAATPAPIVLFDSDGGGSGGGGGNSLETAIVNGAVIVDQMWNTLTANLAAYATCKIQLVIEVDMDANTEESAFDNINFSAGAVLPVEFLDFTANQRKEKVMLNWATATETENEGFAVERSTDGIDFRPIGWVAGNGNADNQTDYQFEDNDVVAGEEYYYRLRQEDFDGAFAYSAIVTVRMDDREGGSIVGQAFPNPAAKGLSNIELTPTTDGTWVISVVDINGRMVSETKYDLPAGYSLLPLDLRNQPSGSYLIRIAGTKETAYQRVIR